VEDLGTRLLVKVAQLYHLQGLNQDQIGRQLGVSRTRVSRMLKEARERGLVEISIRYPSRFSLDLERQLESVLGLREAVVVNAGGGVGSQALSSVAGAAADYLLRVLQPGAVLGVSGGETAQVMLAGPVEHVSVVQLGSALASLGEGAAYSSAEVSLQVAQKLGAMGQLVLIPVPSLLDTETIRDALLGDTGVRQAMALLAGCTIALVGIGALDTVSRPPGATAASDEASADAPRARPRQRCRRRLLPVTDDEATELQNVGAVGEICARFFDRAGSPCVTSLDRRMVALDLGQLRAVPLVIGVACGRQKAAAILGAVRGGYVKTLVTDDSTATAVLALARSAPVDARDGESGRTTQEDGTRDADALPASGARTKERPYG
jgi:DNA-binding transcriptional regulator LsrR (DeoR family)